MWSNRVIDLAKELTQEPNDVVVARKLDELGVLVEVCALSLSGVEVEVEAHLHGVSVVAPPMAGLDTPNLEHCAILA